MRVRVRGSDMLSSKGDTETNQKSPSIRGQRMSKRTLMMTEYVKGGQSMVI
jgi:hypothetical protein